MSSTRTPRHAPADFASLPPITQTVEQARWVEEWAGSGVPLHEHPARRTHGSAACGACHSTDTLVIWARSEYAPVAHGWGPDQWAVTYELACRECGHFTVREGTFAY